MKNRNNDNNSGTPLLIIGAVFLLVLIGGWWFYTSSKSKPIAGNTNTATNVNKPANNTVNYNNASPGAQPPHILGSQTSPVVVEEFADYQCPTCGVKYPVIKQITSIYNNRIKFIFRNFPLPPQVHPKAYDAAVAAEAAGLQNKFWDMQNLLFTKQSEWSASTDHRKLFSDYAQQIGLDVPKFQNDMLGLPAKQRVDSDLERGRGLQINSTPSILVNGVLVPFPQMDVEGLRRIIDAELQKTGNTQNQPKTETSTETGQPKSGAGNK